MRPTENEIVYYVGWEAFGNKTIEYVKNNKNELKDIDVVIGMKRGGAIFANILTCIVGDLCKTKIYIRNIPRGMYSRGPEVFHLVNDITDIQEYMDIKDLFSDLIRLSKEIKKSHENKKLKILIVDDNLTTAKRLIFFSDSIRDFFDRENIEHEIIPLCYIAEKKSLFMKLRNIVDFPADYKMVEMPWHVFKPYTYDLEDKEVIFKLKKIIFRLKKELDIDILFENLEKLEKNKLLSFGIPTKYLDLPSLSRVYGLNKKKKKFFYGGKEFTLKKLEERVLEVKILGNYCSNPKICKPENPRKDICFYFCKEIEKSNFDSEICYHCLFMNGFREFFETVRNSIEKNSNEIIDISLEFRSRKYHNEHLKRIIEGNIKKFLLNNW